MDLSRRELRPQRIKQRLGHNADVAGEVGVHRHHMIGEGVTAEERLRVVSTRPDHRNPLRGLQRQQAGLVLQQHDAGLRHPAGDATVSCGIKIDAVVEGFR